MPSREKVPGTGNSYNQKGIIRDSNFELPFVGSLLGVEQEGILCLAHTTTKGFSSNLLQRLRI